MYKGGNVTLMVSDFERAVTFYTQTLGLDAGVRYGNEWAEVSLKGLTIGLHPAGEMTPEGGAVAIGFEVDDIDAEVAALKAKGVVFTDEIRDADMIRIISFKDLDGYGLYLCQVKQKG
jgi:catechol 2,3-dioxygenase-like lactoylglutathione lyase family enzyme